jgi:uncharacterized protein with FMN-binding domain
MKLKRYFCMKLSSLVIVVAVILGCNHYIAEQNELKAAVLEEQQQMIEEAKQEAAAAQGETVIETTGKYINGIYEGEAQGYGGLVQVRVTVATGQIEDVEILYAGKEDAAYLESAGKVIDEMKETGDTEVDTVSGATFSSTGIIDAAKNALEAAVNE